jgi:hypothetical protein
MDGQEGIGHHDQATIWLVCHCGNDGFELGPVVNRCRDRLHCEGWSGGFEGVQERFGIWRRCWVVQAGEYLEPLSKSFEEDDEAGKLDKAEEIVGVVLPANLGSGAAIDSRRKSAQARSAKVKPLQNRHHPDPARAINFRAQLTGGAAYQHKHRNQQHARR